MRTKLGKYVIKSELGHGAMGVVYLAEDPRLHRPVALKTMSPSVAGDPELLQRFYREAESAGQLRHPNIVTIYDIDEAEGTPFIAMEFLEGDSLEKLIRIRKPLPMYRKLDIIIQTCRGLHYAHQRGIVHRDVKPANIVVLNDGQVKIVDFGIARISDASMTRTGIILGTPMYMSPEQVRGKSVDPRSDIFSLGVILYEFLTFTSPFHAEDVPTIAYKILNEPPAPLRTVIANCPPQLDAVQQKAIAKEREERYQTAEDLAFDLQQQADYVRRNMVDVFVQEGERYFEAGNFTLARESLQRVLELDSGHNLAKNLLNKVQEQLQAHQRAQKVEQGLRQARQALEGRLFDEALDLFEEVLRVDPANEPAQQGKAQAAEQRERNRLINQHLSRAEELASEADLQGTREEVDKVLAIDPAHPRAVQLKDWLTKELVERERVTQVQRHLEDAQQKLSNRDFAAALALLEKAYAIDPVNIEIESLIRSTRESQEREGRRKLLEQRLAEIQEAISLEKLDDAIHKADLTLQELPDNAQIVKLRTQAVRLADLQKRRLYVEQQLQAARDAFQRNDFPPAIAVLEKALETAPDDARLAAYLKTVREAQETARLEDTRQTAVRQASEKIRAQDLAGAVRVLEEATGSVGHSAELTDLLQFARDQQAEQMRQERIRQILGRAQGILREENYEDAIQFLERSQSEVQAPEVAEMLANARGQKRKIEQRRAEMVQQALRHVESNEPAKAVGLLDSAPKIYFKDPNFQKTYAQCREALDRFSGIRRILDNVGASVARDDLEAAEKLLQQGLKTYSGEVNLLAAQKQVQEAQQARRRRQLVKVLDEAKLDMGRMQYREALALLATKDWASAGFPDLAQEAALLRAEANERHMEISARQTVIQQASPLTGAPAEEPVSLLESQRRLREALREGAARHEKLPDQAPHGPMPLSGGPTPQDRGVEAPGVKPPPIAPPVIRPAGPRPTPPPLVTPAKPVRKGLPVAVWAALAVIVLAVVGTAVWLLRPRTPAALGYAQLVTVPWAEVVSVKTAAGETLDLKGQTPMRLELPPGHYAIELKDDQGTGQVEVDIKAGETTRVNYAFPQVNVNALVEELVSKY
ncbi:MAG: protein kinase [Acidobacteriia bacterium]|nr:protein kinase [Terriglobia bacterium]